MLILPVRHHSPGAATAVDALIRARRPKLVLIEGPADANSLIPRLLDRETKPPVAIYAYAAEGEVRASFYPFCDYSPEYVAMQAAKAVGAEVRFCDLPAGANFSLRRESTPLAEENTLTFTSYTDALAQATGFETFEPFWEAAFEQLQPDGLLPALGLLGAHSRILQSDDRTELRERYMAWTARTSGVPLEQIILVCGAAHAEAIQGHLAETAEPILPELTPTNLTLIPFSFPRLSEQSGYGAGNRAPRFYQMVWEHRGDWAAASRLALTQIARHLRQQGHAASLAQVIDGYSLALVLAGMREKGAPGVDEVREAAIACLGSGNEPLVAGALRTVLIGETTGQVTPKIGRSPLQVEFYETANLLGIPIVDAPQDLLLHMPIEREAARSIFLHRLTVIDVPFGTEIKSGLGAAALNQDPLAQLTRVREKWRLQWSPSTDAQLVERTAWGSRIGEVATRLLRERLAAATRVDEATAVLLKLTLCDLTEEFDLALAACELLAADSHSFPALAQATYHLEGLLRYGAARKLPVPMLADLAQRLFARAVLALPAATICGDEGATEVKERLIALFELVRQGSSVTTSTDPFWLAVQTVADYQESHPLLRGLSLLLLELGGRLAPGELGARLQFHLSQSTEATQNAQLVAGLFLLHRATLVRNRALIGAVTEFLLTLSIDQLIPLLPVLRQSLGSLSAAEQRYVGETLAELLGLQAGQTQAILRATATERLLLAELDRTSDQTIHEWRVRYGLQ